MVKFFYVEITTKKTREEREDEEGEERNNH